MRGRGLVPFLYDPIQWPIKATASWLERPGSQRAAYKEFLSLLVGEFGSIWYVKTIYVGSEVGGQMVASAYPHPNRLEVALPLPVEHPAVALIEPAPTIELRRGHGGRMPAQRHVT